MDYHLQQAWTMNRYIFLVSMMKIIEKMVTPHGNLDYTSLSTAKLNLRFAFKREWFDDMVDICFIWCMGGDKLRQCSISYACCTATYCKENDSSANTLKLPLISHIQILVRNRTFRIQGPGQNCLSTTKSEFWAKVLYRIWQLHIPVSPSCSNRYKHFHKANGNVFSYIIENGVCYLCICEKSYPRKLAFSYLEELAKEFNLSYGNEVDKPGLRPYAFVKFGKSAPFPSSNNI